MDRSTDPGPDRDAAGPAGDPTAHDELIRDLAELIAGLQAPYSLNSAILGAAAEPWRRVFHRVSGFGWTDADRIEAELRKLFA